MHSHFIRHCLQLAQKAQGKTGINPLVGACLVSNNQIIAEAWHEGYGMLHAERALFSKLKEKNSKKEIEKKNIRAGVNMGAGVPTCGPYPIANINQNFIKQPQERIPAAIFENEEFFTVPNQVILYINLEPCCHHGKTPPCTDIIIESGIKTVVFGMYDPNPRVAGKGIETLKKHGIEVIGPVLSGLCERFNRGFVSLQKNGRPYITLKKAQTKDGRISNADGSPLKITSSEQNEWAHRHLRATHDAIVVGVQTIINDDPLLTTRVLNESLPHPLRIILDPNGRIPEDARVVGEGTVIVTKEMQNLKLRIKNYKGKILPVESSNINLHWLLNILSTPADVWLKNYDSKHPLGENFYGLKSILVEGGQRTWDSFKNAGLIDEEVVLVGD